MKDKIEILDRYFNTFIDLTDDYEFFTGLVDYLTYLDLIPEIEKVANELPKMRIEEESKIKTLEKIATDELLSARDELKKLVLSKKIKDDRLDNLFKAFEDWLEGRSISSSPVPFSLFDELRSVINILKELGYKKEVSKYVQYFKDNPEIIELFTFAPKFLEYDAEKKLFDNKLKTELWGQFNEMASVYFIVKSGITHHKNLIEEAGVGKNRNMKKWWEAFNLVGLLGEWNQVQNHENRKHKIFFDPQKFRFGARRLHNYLIEKILLQNTENNIEPQPSITDSIASPQSSSMQITLGVLKHRKAVYGYLQLFARSKRIILGKMETRQYRLIKCLFSAENRETDVLYSPAFQGIDRVYENIALSKDKVNGGLKNHPQLEKKRIIDHTIKEIQKIKDLQGYINFEWWGDKTKLRMNIHPKEG